MNNEKHFIVGLYGEIQLITQYFHSNYTVQQLNWMQYIGELLQCHEHYSLISDHILVEWYGDRDLAFEQKFKLSIKFSHTFFIKIIGKNLTPGHHIKYFRLCY